MPIQMEKIEQEILGYCRELSNNIMKIARMEIGESITIKQACNYIGPQIRMTPDECYQIVILGIGSVRNADRK